MSEGQRIDIIALIVMCIGIALSLTGAYITIYGVSNFDIKKDVLGWGSYFIGVITATAGYYGYRRRKINDMTLKRIDLTWMCFGAAGAFFAFVAIPISQTDEQWTHFLAQNNDAKAEITKILDKTFKLTCPGFNILTSQRDDSCTLLRREMNQLSSDGSIPMELDEIIKRDIIPKSDITTLSGRANYIVENARFYDGTWYKIFHDAKPHGEPIFKLFLLLAVALRLNKSIIEVYWMPRKHYT